MRLLYHKIGWVVTISYKAQAVEEIKAEPEKYGIMAGAKFLTSFTNRHAELYMSYFGFKKAEYQEFTESDFIIATGDYDLFVGTLDGHNGKCGLTTTVTYTPSSGKIVCDVAPWSSMDEGSYYFVSNPTCYLFLVPGGVNN